MNAEPNHRPTELLALLAYLDDLALADAGLAYVLHKINGTWQLSALLADELPNLTRPQDPNPLLTVNLGADLRSAEPGAITTVQTTTVQDQETS